MYIQLPVSAAFHSRYLLPVAEAFEQFLKPFTFQTLRAPVIANATAEPYPNQDPTADVRHMLVRQITCPVLWAQTIRRLRSAGVNELKEIGHGTVLTDLIRQIPA